MKNVFEVILMLWIGLTILFCMVIFSEEVFIRQESIQIRNKVNEIIEINSGYTDNAENEINNLLSKIKYETEIEVSKIGKLDYGEEIEYKVTIFYIRDIPFLNIKEEVSYPIEGEYYNING